MLPLEVNLCILQCIFVQNMDLALHIQRYSVCMILISKSLRPHQKSEIYYLMLSKAAFLLLSIALWPN